MCVAYLEGGLQTLLDVTHINRGLAHVELEQDRMREVGEPSTRLLLQREVAEQAVEHCAHDDVAFCLGVGSQLVRHSEVVGQGNFVVAASGVEGLKGRS